MSEKFIVRILTIGYTDVGKTSILVRFTKDQFSDKYVSTIGIDFKSKPLKIGNTIVKVTVFDTAGQEKYKGIVKSFYNKANGVILAFDLTDKESFSRIDYWVEELKQHKGSEELYIVLVGNKKDRNEERQVSYEEALKFAEDNNFGGYFEVSAKTGEGINELFIDVAKGALKKVLDKNCEGEGINESIKLSIPENKVSKPKNKICC